MAAARKSAAARRSAKPKPPAGNPVWKYRSQLVLGVFGVVAVLLVGRSVQLQVIDRDFLVGQAESRYLHQQAMQTPRRKIVDRNNEPLAISAPSATVWANPARIKTGSAALEPLADLLGMTPTSLRDYLRERSNRQFVYLKRHLSPEVAARVRALDIKGVQVEREYRRFYPMGEVSSHVLGFTNVDDRGQEGVERSFDDHLRTPEQAFSTRRDRRGRVIEFLGGAAVAAGNDETEALALSMDSQIQYVAYRELKAAAQRHNAKGGSAVVVDVQTGEVLAMVNQPGFNPHVRDGVRWSSVRNRAVTDVFEPGSTLKPLIIAAALESGQYQQGTTINTAPGHMQVGSLRVKDFRNYGTLDLAGIIRKSSNVGVSKIALDLDPERLWNVLARLGFGLGTGSGLPGEANGSLPHFTEWGRVGQATLAYGYGISVTALQLAQAYTVIAAQGRQRPLSLLRVNQAELPVSEPIVRPDIARQVLEMMETVTQSGGTGRRAAIPGYRVAGKTGTVRKVSETGYSTDHYRAVFVGVVPVSQPRFVMVVMVDEPQGDYYGGLVAAPVFSRTMSEVLRVKRVPPDAERSNEYVLSRSASANGGA